ncbi:two-component sensor histidine kinase [Serinibacter arcticus]|uniref:histidine kinase n=1 Tax=Serinibacter arcticus TaxID=1655435 RepID=A0A4Z1E821_9MICO|nr:two-component sensor histidine kinase [Serinibacter arcticus]
MAPLVRGQLPFLLGFALVSALLIATGGADGRWWAALAVVVGATALLVVTIARGAGDPGVVVAAVLDMVAVAVLDTIAWDGSPTVVGLMVLPALWLSHGFRARLLPFVVAVTAVPALTAAALVLGDQDVAALPGIAAQVALVVIVAVVVHIGARGARDQEVALERTAQELHATIALSQAVADAIDVGVSYSDDDGVVLLRNQAVKDHGERAGYDFVTRRAIHLYGPDRTTPLPHEQQAPVKMLRGEPVQGDVVFVGPPGDQQALSFTATPLTTVAEGGPGGSVLVCQDVTDLVNAVTTREEMVVTFSHELRTPLTSIIGFTEVMRETHDLAELGLERQVDVIHRNASALLDLILVVLQAGSAARGITVERVPADAVALVSATVEDLRAKAGRCGTAVTVDVAETATTISADPVRIRQAFEQLLTNAFKFGALGGRTRVSIDGDEEELRIAVVDDGPGIDPQDLSQLFERGFRTVAARRSTTQGLGLGLPLARDIARAHGGDVTVATRPGQGSTFTLHLPRD